MKKVTKKEKRRGKERRKEERKDRGNAKNSLRGKGVPGDKLTYGTTITKPCRFLHVTGILIKNIF